LTRSRFDWVRPHHCLCPIHTGNRFTHASLTESSKYETRKLDNIISQLHHITITKHFATTAII